MDLQLKDKLALVSGSTAGSGFAIANGLAHEGARVIVIGRTAGRVNTAIKRISPTLGNALRRLLAAKISLEGASDHGVSEALYLRHPDQNGLELYRDRPK
jgi:NADP-dependent 3-hydroxy acid dehydrogenase YdfG